MSPFTSNYTFDFRQSRFLYGNLQQIHLLQLTRGLPAPAAQLFFLQEIESPLRVNISVTINYTLVKTHTYRITNGYWKITINISVWNFCFGLGLFLFIFSCNFSFSGYSLYFIFWVCSKQLLLWSDGMKLKSY